MSEYYYLPKELVTPQYADYSLQTKMLFSIVISEAETAKSVMEMSQLINDIGSKNILALIKSAHAINESEGD